MKSYVVLGEAMPEGATVYVLRKELAGGSIEMWAPLTGECYFFEEKISYNEFLSWKCKPTKYLEMRLNDPMCPMKKVHCVISDDNLYANV